MAPFAQSEPWQNLSELALLRDNFYPSNAQPDPFSIPSTDMRQNAIDSVSAFVFRNPWTPHAVVATANLTEASLQYNQHGGSLSDNALRSIYAMAFVKFVNGFVDRDIAAANTAGLGDSEEIAVDHNAANTGSDSEDAAPDATSIKVKGGGESSMYAFAAKIDMPEDFVDLRHNIVHGDIPSLSTLRNYNEEALRWLWERWWRKGATGDPAQAREKHQAQQELAELGRRKSIEAWKAYAAGDGLHEGSHTGSAKARRQWDEYRMQQALSGTEV